MYLFFCILLLFYNANNNSMGLAAARKLDRKIFQEETQDFAEKQIEQLRRKIKSLQLEQLPLGIITLDDEFDKNYYNAIAIKQLNVVLRSYIETQIAENSEIASKKIEKTDDELETVPLFETAPTPSNISYLSKSSFKILKENQQKEIGAFILQATRKMGKKSPLLVAAMHHWAIECGDYLPKGYGQLFEDVSKDMIVPIMNRYNQENNESCCLCTIL